MLYQNNNGISFGISSNPILKSLFQETNENQGTSPLTPEIEYLFEDNVQFLFEDGVKYVFNN